MLQGSQPTDSNAIYVRVDWWQEPISTTSQDIYFEAYLCAGKSASKSYTSTAYISMCMTSESYVTSGSWQYTGGGKYAEINLNGYSVSSNGSTYLGWTSYTTSTTKRALVFTGYLSGTNYAFYESSTNVLQMMQKSGYANDYPYIMIYFDPLMVKGTVTAGYSFTDEGTPQMSYSLPSYDQMSEAKVRISWDGGYTSWRTVTLAATGSHTFTLTDGERTSLRNASKNTNSYPVKYELKGTFTNGEEFTDSWDSSCTIVNANPTLSPTVKDTRSDAINITQNDQVLIIGFSTASYAFNATALKGATIVSYEVTNGQSKRTSSTGTFANVESEKFVFKVTDSRGNIATQTVTKYYVNYKALSLNIEVQPAEFVDTTTARIPFYISGQYFNGKFGDEPNAIALSYRYRIGYSGSYSSWTTVTPTLNGNAYYYTAYVTADYSATVFIEASVGDRLNNITKSTNSTIKPVFDWGDSDFNFNVPVTINDAEVPTIVEQGEYDNWTYRKWTDGTAECWRNYTISTSIVNATSGWYSSGELYGTNLYFPFTFKERPSVNVSVMPTGATWAVVFPSNTGGSTSQTGSYQLMSTSSFTSKSYILSYQVKGRWQ